MTDLRDVTTPLGARDPEVTRRIREHVLAGTTDLAPEVLSVPIRYYRDPELFARERQMLLTTPIAVVAGAQLANPNDYVVRDLLGTSLLVTRDADGRAQVLVNYCRHRGAKPARGCGNARRFTCPYHGWVYDSRGALVGIPGDRGFTEVERSETGLVELPTEERHGLIWAVLSTGAALDLDGHLGPLGADLELWKMADYHYLKDREFESPTNWKSALEAFAESYHFPYVHGESLIGQNTIADTAVYQQLGRHHRVCFPTLGVRDLDEDSNWDPIEHLANIYWIYPNLVLAFTQVGVELIDILPGDSPISCRVRHGWMARFPATTAEQLSGYENLYELVHAAVRDEDFGMLPQCGEAVLHARHSDMLIGRNEIAVQNVIKTFSAAVGFELNRTSGPSR